MAGAHPSITVYGIPSCGTVKKARTWLLAHDMPHTFVDFRKSPVSAERVRAWVDALGAAAMKNTSGGSYRALPAEKATWDDGSWATRMAADPMLVKRPVIEVSGKPVTAGFRTPDALASALGSIQG